MKTIINLIFISTLTFTITSCGGSKEETEKKEMSLCDCYGLKDKYDSKEDAEKELGKESVDKCMDILKDASDEDLAKCK